MTKNPDKKTRISEATADAREIAAAIVTEWCGPTGEGAALEDMIACALTSYARRSNDAAPDRTPERDAIADWLERRGCLGEANAVRWWNRPRSSEGSKS